MASSVAGFDAAGDLIHRRSVRIVGHWLPPGHVWLLSRSAAAVDIDVMSMTVQPVRKPMVELLASLLVGPVRWLNSWLVRRGWAALQD